MCNELAILYAYCNVAAETQQPREKMVSQAQQRVQQLLDPITHNLYMYKESDPVLFDVLICHLNQLPEISYNTVVSVADSLRILVLLREEDGFCSILLILVGQGTAFSASKENTCLI